MLNNQLISKSIFITIQLISFVSTQAQDRLFNYTYHSGVLNKEQREIEVWNTFRAGKNDYFARLDNRTEFEVGFRKNLRTTSCLRIF